mgnify:CR=1 FL=1
MLRTSDQTCGTFDFACAWTFDVTWDVGHGRTFYLREEHCRLYGLRLLGHGEQPGLIYVGLPLRPVRLKSSTHVRAMRLLYLEAVRQR